MANEQIDHLLLPSSLNSKVKISPLGRLRSHLVDQKKPQKLILHSRNKQPTKVLVIGAGSRITTNYVDALSNLKWPIEVIGLWSRTAENAAKAAKLGNWPHIETLNAEVLEQAQVIVMTVQASAAASLVHRVTSLVDCHQKTLVIDTPVFAGLKDIFGVKDLSKFRNVVVAEDYINFPQFLILRQLALSDSLGHVRRIEIDQLGYRYHGLALGRAMFGFDYVEDANLCDGQATFYFSEARSVAMSSNYHSRSGQITLFGSKRKLVYVPANNEMQYLMNISQNKNVLTEHWQGHKLVGFCLKRGNLYQYHPLDVLRSKEPEACPFQYFKTLGLIKVFESIFELNAHSAYDYNEGLLDNYVSNLVLKPKQQMLLSPSLIKHTLAMLKLTISQSPYHFTTTTDEMRQVTL